MLPEWTHTIQFRLALGFAALLSICIFGVSVWSTNATRMAIDDYNASLSRFREAQTNLMLQEFYASNVDLRTLQNSIEQIGRLYSLRVALVDAEGFVVADSHQFPTDAEGKYETELERFKRNSKDYRSVPFTVEDDIVGKIIFESKNGDRPDFDVLEIVPPRRHGRFVEVESPFQRFADRFPNRSVILREVTGMRSIPEQAPRELAVEPQLSALQREFRRSLVVSGVVGGIASVLVVIAFTRIAFAPMRHLTLAARKLGKGELDHRIDGKHRGEIGHLANTFNSMAADLETAETRRRRMTADVAHELRTPLTNVRGYIEAIKDGVVEANYETIETLHKETIHLSTLVEDLRILAIADAGELTLDVAPEDIRQIVASVVQAFKPRASAVGVELTTECDDALKPVAVDRTRMTQVIHNLVDNALNHSVSGNSVNIKVLRAEDSTVRISVVDQGKGIPAEDHSRVFDQFYRVDASRTRSTGGTGLGLTIVKRIVEAHRGTIDVASKVGAGTTFIIDLPTEQNDAELK